MRYYFLSLMLVALAVLSLAGFRGCTSRQPPREFFTDMVRQPRLRPQKPHVFFADAHSSRRPVPGVMARGSPFEDSPVNTGRAAGTTNWVDTNPLPVTAELLARGRERFAIYCVYCHSAVGDGHGITTKYGMLRAGNFHDPRLVRMPDGELFHTLTAGKNLMPAYAAQVTITNRWSIVAYVRALQRAGLGNRDDMPDDLRPSLAR